MEAISTSGRIPGEGPLIHGVIIGRRSIGRNLAFAEIRIAESPKDDYGINGAISIKVMFNRQSFLGPVLTADMNITDVDAGHLGDCTLLNDSFPTKKSRLPYGANITLLLGKKCIKKSSFDDGDRSRDVCSWEVIRWKIVHHPKEMAERFASLNIEHASIEEESAKQSHHNQANNQREIVMGNGALSYSTYLKIRRQQFDNAISGKPDCFRKTVDRRNKDVLISNHKRTPKMTEANEPTAEFSHGDKHAKGKRAKIFAAWVLDTFFGLNSTKEGIYCEPCNTDRFEVDAKSCKEPSLHNDRSLIQNVHVLDIAGGKGHLSLELVLQQLSSRLSGNTEIAASRISRCTIIDPVVRKGDVKLRHPRLKKRRVSHSKSQTDDSVRTQIPIITHLATSFTADSFTYINESFSNSFDHNTSSTDGSLPKNLLLLGLHPDQCTEDIVDAALEHNLPFAVVPCCVFPDLFPTRKYWREVGIHCGNTTEGGRKLQPAKTYSDFLEYLMQKDQRIKMTALPFKGKNIVLYRVVA